MNTFHLFEKFVKTPLTPAEVAKAKTPEGLKSRSEFCIRSRPRGGFGLFHGSKELAIRIGPFVWRGVSLVNGLQAETRRKVQDMTVDVLKDLSGGSPATLSHLVEGSTAQLIHEVSRIYAWKPGLPTRDCTLSQGLACGGYMTLAGTNWSFDA